METEKIIYEDDQYYAVALVHYTVESEGDGIDYPVMVEVEIDSIEFLSCQEFDGEEWQQADESEEIKSLIETEFRRL